MCGLILHLRRPPPGALLAGFIKAARKGINRTIRFFFNFFRRNLERWIENLVNCSIDISKVLLVVDERRIPQTYKEILREIGTVSSFDEEFGEALSRWATLRNILAHEYLDMRWKSINDFLQSAEPVYKRLVDTVKSLLTS